MFVKFGPGLSSGGRRALGQTEVHDWRRTAARPEPAGAAVFRTAMRRHAAGVCIVSVGTGQAIAGMTVSSATAFSLEPPAVLFCVNLTASLVPQLGCGQPFSLSVLGRHHQAVARAFSSKPSGRERFETGQWSLDETGTPWLEDAPANICGRVVHTLAYGTHIAVIGSVDRIGLGGDAPSLLYRDGNFF